jgi:hypothetical protein
MKKAILIYCFILLSSILNAYDFSLPKIETTLDSLQSAFSTLLDNTAGMGFIDYGSSWYGDQSARYKEYLDSVLENMTYGKVRSYVEKLDAAIKGFDWMDVSRNRQAEFEKFISASRGGSVFAWELPPNISNFTTWVGFFKNENNDIRDWLISKENKEGLYGMLNEIPQRYYAEYKARLDEFCTGWGL